MTEPAGSGRWNLLPLHLDTVHYPEGHPRAGEFGPVYAYLLEDDEHLVLVDTGIGPSHEVIDRLYAPTRRDVVLALAQNNGIEPADVDAIVVSHLHFDHVGGAQFFGDTPIYVQRTEWEAAQAEQYTIPEWLTFEGANFVMLDGDADLASGLQLVVTGDHTPGHQVVAVSTPVGTIVLAGQSVETCAEFEAMVASGELSAGARAILALEPARVMFSHDHRVWER